MLRHIEEAQKLIPWPILTCRVVQRTDDAFLGHYQIYKSPGHREQAAKAIVTRLR